MAKETTDEAPDKRPLFVYDGDCGFCKRSVERLKLRTGDAVQYIPFQDRENRPSTVSEEEYSEAVHLFLPDQDKPLRGAEAVYKTLKIGNRPALHYLYGEIPWFGRISEAAYRFVARRRKAMSRLTLALYGKSLLPSTYRFSSWMFGRALGLVALIAFISYWSQAEGLVGPEGIMPLEEQLDKVETATEKNPDDLPGKGWLLPTLLWYSPTWDTLVLLLGCGILFSALLMGGIAPAVSVIGIWACYLSVMVVSAPFLNFQWDILLLETCFLSACFLPWVLFSGPRSTPNPSKLGRFLIVCLLFKLMFESGIVKFTYFGANHSNTWEDLSALDFHYWTQPIPNWSSWYFDRLSASFDKASLWFMYTVELVLPFFFFLPRNLRRLAFGGQVLLQILIMVSGNYGFFNLLTLVLCLPLLDDQILPSQWKAWLMGTRKPMEEKTWVQRVRLAVILPIGALSLYLGWIYLERDFKGNSPSLEEEESSEWKQLVLQKTQPFRSINSYGLFRVMTQTRPELQVEASMDGENWEPYEFKWKPGDPQRAPEFFIPHMPRLDWQMWFEALNAEGYSNNPTNRFLYGRFLTVIAKGGDQESLARPLEALGPVGAAQLANMNLNQQRNFMNYYFSTMNMFLHRSMWFARFLERLAQAEPTVLELLEKAPHGEKKPRFLRVTLWQYEFASPEKKEKQGLWWERAQIQGSEVVIENPWAQK